MGVPKFYRWISERYPCLSEVIKQYQIPEFDNLYLDMNGIIHVCSHPNDDDPHFRISEQQIFADIFHYIDFLFKMIKPKEVFFMAVDGVAPRAKMNQQRGRRFRTARDAATLELKARENGEVLPEEARFDSNCITPGTVFMARLHKKLKSFVSYKITTDKLWQKVRVYLSGHETPGEGEHKIMDFIRYERSQSGYNPNTRHCLYGLDADLILLGLSSHEPHFSLLREEVRFGGRKNQKRTMSPEETTFHLLHLSLLREYLEYEFLPVKKHLPFEFNVENIIDDFVLMSFLVGNDFIPHLPQLHIQHDALPMLYDNYIKVLPTLDGYINEGGYLNLERFEMFLAKLSEHDLKKFSESSCDFRFLEGKRGKKGTCGLNDFSISDELDDFSNGINDIDFVSSKKTLGFSESLSDSKEDDDESLLVHEFEQHKKNYYREKLEYDDINEDVLRDQAEGYVRAIQWNLHYYYNGVVSWSWYFQHHYSPFISDIKDFRNMRMEFDMGEPFLPFQQLLAVLPEASNILLPKPYQDLMCNEDSILKDFFPKDFRTDMNGKQQEWEAVVLIPFINEKLLLKCTAEIQNLLNEEEKKRNTHGPHLLYKHSELSCGPCASFLPHYFPDIPENHASCEEIPKDFFRLPATAIKKGLYAGVQLDTFFPGFPTLKHIPHSSKLRQGKVRVFQSYSYKDSMILTIILPHKQELKEIVDYFKDKTLYVNWPHLQEAIVESFCDGNVCYKSAENGKGQLVWEQKLISKNEKDVWEKQCISVKDYYYQRLGVEIGDINILINAKCLLGSKFTCSEDGRVIESKQWATVPTCHAFQVIVKNIAAHCPEYKREKSVRQLFPCGSTVFMLGFSYYGSMGEIIDNNAEAYHGRIVVKFNISADPDLQSVIENRHNLASENYMPCYKIAQMIGLRSHFISRLTGTFLIQTNSKESISPNQVNIGLNLKFNRKNEEVQGFSKKTDDGQWLYSEQVVKIMREYAERFPDFFQKLNSFLKDDIIYLEDLYPDGSGLECVNQIVAWLKSQRCASAERQSCGMDMVDEGVIKSIQEMTNFATNQKTIFKKITVKPHLLYSPFCSKGFSMPDPSANFQLFDRVINVDSSLTVPLGLKGIIIGVKPAEKDCDFIFEVLFDKEFFGGMVIRCSTKKAYRMPPSALINISYGKRISKADKSITVLCSNASKVQVKNNSVDSLKTGHSAKGNRNAVLSANFGEYTNKKYKNFKFSPKASVLEKKIPENYSFKGEQFHKPGEDSHVRELKPALNSNISPQNLVSKFQDSNKSEFVTPKISANMSGPNKIRQKQISPQSLIYESSWNTLMKRSSPDLSPVEEKKDQSFVPKYGHQVSVKELFEGAQKSGGSKGTCVQDAAAVKHEVPQTKGNLSHLIGSGKVGELMDYCLEHFGEVPEYSYQSLPGMTPSEEEITFISCVKLPNGKKFEGTSSTKLDASERAASTALLNIKDLQINSHINYESSQPPDSNAVRELVECCKKYFNEPPEYFKLYLKKTSPGPTRTVVSRFRVPNGKIFERTSFTELLACQEAASAALSFLQWNHVGSSRQLLFPCSNVLPIQRYCQPNMDFMMHNRIHRDIPILRHPQPPSVLCIPNSFVDHNQQILQGQIRNFPFQYRNSFSPQLSTLQDSISLAAQCSLREVKNQKYICKDSEGVKSLNSPDNNMFVPLQVTKNTRKSRDSVHHTDDVDSEWPHISQKNIVRTSSITSDVSKQNFNVYSRKENDHEDSVSTFSYSDEMEAACKVTSPSDSNRFAPIQVTRENSKKSRGKVHQAHDSDSEGPFLLKESRGSAYPGTSCLSQLNSSMISDKKNDHKDLDSTFSPSNETGAAHKMTIVPSAKVQKCKSKRTRKPKIAAKFTVEPE